MILFFSTIITTWWR